MQCWNVCILNLTCVLAVGERIYLLDISLEMVSEDNHESVWSDVLALGASSQLHA